MTTAVDVDLRIDLNTMDETGLPWTFLDQAPDPSRIIPGRHIAVSYTHLTLPTIHSV